MTSSSKNSKLLFFAEICLLIIAAVVYLNVYSENRSKRNLNSAQYYENIVRDGFIKMRYWVKSTNKSVLPSEDITVIGIDDKTQQWFGKFGNATWSTRLPYDANLRYLQKYFPPACLSFDIIFRADTGSFQGELELDAISSDPDKINGLAAELVKYSEELERVAPKSLIEMSSLVSEQGEFLMAFALGNLQSPPPGSNLQAVPVICAYNLVEQELSYLYDASEYKKREYYTWSQEEMFGDDPEYPDEELGTAVPYMLESAIPNENISNISNDYVFLPKASLISPNFIDMVDLGYINVRRDRDGSVRRIPLVLGTKYFSLKKKGLENIFVPSFALLSCMKFWGLEVKDVTVKFGEYIHLKNEQVDKKIPIDLNGKMILNADSTEFDFNYVSFKDINEYGMALSTKGEEAFSGPYLKKLNQLRSKLTKKICLVGLTATGNADTGPTSLGTNTSYVYAHATAINSILKDSYLVPASDMEVLMLLLFPLILICIFGARLKLRYFSVVTLMILTLVVVFNFYAIYYNVFYLPILYISVTIVVSFIVILLVRYFTEGKEKAQVRKMFSTMVSASVLEYMDNNPESFSLSGQKVSASIMFSDVAGFTSISEGLSPEKLVMLLNKYLTPMTDIIMGHDGYIDKYEGDAIMAEWGVPFANDKHATLACYACLDQQQKLDEIRDELYQEFGYELFVRIGVNSGEVSAGNMGSEDRFSYTVMGDAVNLAARLEPTNKVYGTYLMIGQSTYELAKDDIEARLLDKVVVVGKKESIRVYELLARKGDISSEKRAFVEHYEKGLDLHEKRLWDKAIEQFEAALKIEESDTASKVLIERIEEYRLSPPAENWQGEYVRKSKD